MYNFHVNILFLVSGESRVVHDEMYSQTELNHDPTVTTAKELKENLRSNSSRGL